MTVDAGSDTGSGTDELYVVRTTPADPVPGAPTVVFVHGAMDRGLSFGRVIRLLADVPVVRYDRRGYGRSHALAPVGLDVGAADLLAIVGDGPAVVVGHSMGGVLALMAAEQRPDAVVSVVAYEAPMPWTPWWHQNRKGSGTFLTAGLTPEESAERFMRTMIGDERWDRLPARGRAERRAEGPALLADLGAMRGPGAPYDAHLLSVPVVAGCGSESSVRHRRAALELAATAPQGELMEVVGADHGVHLTHPADLAAMARRAIARVAP
ncbi:MAG TPA: alpha/beta hydrolase [Acidimicrobiales bacterium]|jgi:pimeloyl-ACP methyl ester carboxylesterase